MLGFDHYPTLVLRTCTAFPISLSLPLLVTRPVKRSVVALSISYSLASRFWPLSCPSSAALPKSSLVCLFDVILRGFDLSPGLALQPSSAEGMSSVLLEGFVWFPCRYLNCLVGLYDVLSSFHEGLITLLALPEGHPRPKA